VSKTKQQPTEKKQASHLKDFLCKPVKCPRRKIVQFEWFCRDKAEPAEEGKPQTVAPWRTCHYVVDEDYAHGQAERLRKRGHTVTFEAVPAK
jgi:hypothetical protein